MNVRYGSFSQTHPGLRVVLKQDVVEQALRATLERGEHPTQEQLAQDTGLTFWATRAALEALETRGVIVTERKGLGKTYSFPDRPISGPQLSRNHRCPWCDTVNCDKHSPRFTKGTASKRYQHPYRVS